MSQINFSNFLRLSVVAIFGTTLITGNSACSDNPTATADTTKTNTAKDATPAAESNEEKQSTASAGELFTKYALDKVKLPAGFSISVFAQVPDARSMCWGEKGTLFIGNRNQDKVYAAVDSDNDGRADKVY